MMIMKVYTDRAFAKLLKDNGYEKIRSNGDHIMYSDGTNTISVNRGINRMVAQRIIKENNLKEGVKNERKRK